jgi:hypothetical protein
VSDALEHNSERPESTERSLYIDDRELRRRINPTLGWDRFRAAVRKAEATPSRHSGLVFPKVSALWGGRYWPAAKAWFDDENGVHEHGHIESAEDGVEDFDATAGRKTRIQARAAPAAVLDRPPGRARPDGLSGNVRAFTTRS